MESMNLGNEKLNEGCDKSSWGEIMIDLRVEGYIYIYRCNWACSFVRSADRNATLYIYVCLCIKRNKKKRRKVISTIMNEKKKSEISNFCNYSYVTIKEKVKTKNKRY